MRSNSWRRIALATMAGALCGVPLVAKAGPVVVILPGYAATQTASASAAFAANDSVTTHNLGTWSHSNTSPASAPFASGYGSASGSVTGTPNQLITGSVSAFLTPGSVPGGFETRFENDASYSATLLYSMEVLGPTSTAQVQFHSRGQFATSSADPGMRFGAFVHTSVAQVDDGGDFVSRLVDDTSSISTFGDNVNATSDVTGSFATGFTGGYNDNSVYTFLTGTRYLVGLQFEIDTHVNGFGGTDSVSGFLDPTFAIASGTPNAGDYSFVFSDGIGNTPAGSSGGAPEPAAWALMLMGFGLAGSALRWRTAAA